jgi:hypothetical protein
VTERPIPEDYWRDLVAFLESEKTGQVVLHVVRGKVVGIDCTATKRDRDKVPTS